MLAAPSPPPASIEASSGRSAEVTTAFTPGKVRALEASIRRILACACGLRSTRPQSMSGKDRSAPKLARPVTLSTPSCRIGRVPTQRNFFASAIPLPPNDRAYLVRLDVAPHLGVDSSRDPTP